MLNGIDIKFERDIKYYNDLVHPSISYDKLNKNQQNFIFNNFNEKLKLLDTINNKNYKLDNIITILIWQFIKIVFKLLQEPNIDETASRITHNNINKYLCLLGFKKIKIINEEYWDKPEWMLDEHFW